MFFLFFTVWRDHDQSQTSSATILALAYFTFRLMKIRVFLEVVCCLTRERQQGRRLEHAWASGRPLPGAHPGLP